MWIEDFSLVWQFEPVLGPNWTNRTGSIGSGSGSGPVQWGTHQFGSHFSKMAEELSWTELW